jgi:heat-inducible transcriptional repressor
MIEVAAAELSERQREILTAIIEDFIATAEPVGSRSLTRRQAIHLSPATVRNTMADLEELGLLSAPHASAGRVPTVAAFRIYVERLASRGRITARERELIQALTQQGQEHRDLRTVLQEAGRVLSGVSKHAALVLMPRLDEVIFESVEFLPLRDAVLTVFVAKSGLIQHRVVGVPFPLDRDELVRMSNYLNSMLGGKTLIEVRAEILRAMDDERSQADQMMRQALYVGARALRQGERDDAVLVQGERSFLEHPEFADIQRMRKLLRAFEEKSVLVQLLDAVTRIDAQAASHAETAVVLGSESSVRDLRDLAAVTATYMTEDGSGGRVGVVGPTRMDYSRLIPLVEMTARAVSDSLQRGAAAAERSDPDD